MESPQLSQQDYEDLVTNASDAIWIQDMAGNITLANKASEKLTGYPASKLVGKKVNKFLAPEALSLAREVKAKLLSGEVMDQRYEQRIVRKDGSEAIIQLATRLIVTDGKPQAFQHMARDITEEKQLRDYLQFYLRECLKAQEEERKRLACELHDDTLQMILLLSRRLDNLVSKVSHYLPQELKDELENLYDLSQQTYHGLKRYAQALRPRILDDLGLVPALKWLAQELSNLAEIEVQAKANDIPSLPPETQLVLFRIAQEALRNIHRHSGASEASITLEYREDEDKIRMTIADNGRGFEPPKRVSDFASQGKLGLTGMVERIQLVGGGLEVISQPGKGTRIVVRTPTKLHTENND